MSNEIILRSFINKLYKAIFFILMILGFSSNLLAEGESKSPLNDEKKQLKLAKKFLRKGEFKSAESILKNLLAKNPKNTKAKLDLAYIFLKRKNLDKAYDYAYSVAKEDSKNAYAFAILGASYLQTGKFSEAKQLLHNALYLDKKVALAWAAYGMLNFYENKIDLSLNNLREAVYRDSSEPDFIFALAQVASRSEKYLEAANAYEKFLHIAPKTDKERRDRIKGLTSFLRYLGKKSSLYDTKGKKITSIKFDLSNNRPVIKLRLKKKGELLKFVLDTGSGISVLSKKTAKRLKIKKVATGGKARALGGDGRFNIVYGFLKKVYIGDVKVLNVPIYIREFHNTKENIDGYIGLSLISKFITTIDYGNSTFALQRKNKTSEPVFEKDSMSIPLRLTSSGFLSGEVKLKGIESPLNFIVDTGASISVISEDLAGLDEVNQHILEGKMRVIGAAGITENVSSFLSVSYTHLTLPTTPYV